MSYNNEKKPRSEVSIQFEEIYKAHHDPEERAKKRILNNRKKRAEYIKRDLGIQ